MVGGELFVVADDNFFSVDVASSRTRKRRKINFEKISSGLVNLEISGTASQLPTTATKNCSWKKVLKRNGPLKKTLIVYFRNNFYGVLLKRYKQEQDETKTVDCKTRHCARCTFGVGE